jgi:hypothetical protein
MLASSSLSIVKSWGGGGTTQSFDIFNVPANICLCENKNECELYNYLEKRKSHLSGEKYRIMLEEKKWNKYRVISRKRMRS